MWKNSNSKINDAIMEYREGKQTERFSVIVKGSDYFLSLDDKSKQIYKVKINNMQGYDLSQIYLKGRTSRWY